MFPARGKAAEAPTEPMDFMVVPGLAAGSATKSAPSHVRLADAGPGLAAA